MDSATQLTLDADIFKYVGEHYHVHLHTGTSTTATANKLIDSAAVFNNAAYIVKKGDLVKNLTDGTEATVVTVDSATQLTLDTGYFYCDREDLRGRVAAGQGERKHRREPAGDRHPGLKCWRPRFLLPR